MFNIFSYLIYIIFHSKKEIMNPFSKFNKWFNLAKKEYEYDHTAFALSTCVENKPFVRMVLLKKILNDGYVFLQI